MWSRSRPRPAARWPRSAKTGKPQFLECLTYRFRAHSMFDAQLYRDKAEVEDWREKGPILRFQTWLTDNGLIHAEDVAEIEAESQAEIDAAVDFRREQRLGAGGDAHALMSRPRTALPRQSPQRRQERRSRSPIARPCSRPSARP